MCIRDSSSTWPSTAAPPPNSRPNPGTPTSPASAATSSLANRPPHRSPPTPTPPPAANPADPHRNGGWRSLRPRRPANATGRSVVAEAPTLADSDPDLLLLGGVVEGVSDDVGDVSVGE